MFYASKQPCAHILSLFIDMANDQHKTMPLKVPWHSADLILFIKIKGHLSRDKKYLLHQQSSGVDHHIFFSFLFPLIIMEGLEYQ